MTYILARDMFHFHRPDLLSGVSPIIQPEDKFTVEWAIVADEQSLWVA
jgi:hypothetical protein